jgi:transcriptional regulator of acetoin/glycerol metabolism
MTKQEEERRARQRRASEEQRERLGWRINEWVELTGMSRPTIWRQAKKGKLRIAYIGTVPIVPRTEAVRLGLIDA